MTWQGIWLNSMVFRKDILRFLTKPRNEKFLMVSSRYPKTHVISHLFWHDRPWL